MDKLIGKIIFRTNRRIKPAANRNPRADTPDKGGAEE